MPYINIKLTPEALSAEKKRLVIRDFTAILAKHLGKNPATTIVIIDEVDTDNWGIAGESVTCRRARLR